MQTSQEHLPRSPRTPANGEIEGAWRIVIARPRQEVYAFWRRFDNLALVFDHIKRIEPMADGRSHWVVKAPAGLTAEWEAEIIEEDPGRRIAWNSTGGGDVDGVDNSGSVEFLDAPDGLGTEVRILLRYEPPGGRFGQAVARFLGRDPSVDVPRDLERLKLLMETGRSPR